MKNLMFYGDSNTWGFDPETGGRYDYHERWTSICAGILGGEYHCVAEGMNGRTTVFQDPLKGCRSGTDGLDYALQSHKPLDLCVIMLGTNDLKYTDAKGSAAGMEHLIRLVLTANERFRLSSPVFPDGPKILLISPVAVRGDIGRMEVPGAGPCAFRDTGRSGHFPGIRPEERESLRMSTCYQELASQYGLHYMNAAQITEPSRTDGIHLDREGHAALGEAVADAITRWGSRA